MRYIASVSFGKDSLAMLLLVLEKEMPLDEVIFYNSGMEFQAIYDIRDRMKPVLEQRGIRFTEVKPDAPFLYDMLEKTINSRKNGFHHGYGWCGGLCRWGTTLKIKAPGRPQPRCGSPLCGHRRRRAGSAGASEAAQMLSSDGGGLPGVLLPAGIFSGRKTVFGSIISWTGSPAGAAKTRTGGN